MAASCFGWDLVYKLAERDIKQKEDVLVVFVHWFLVKSGLKCVGLGDDTKLPENEGSEALPDGWNNSAVYALRYVHNKKVYLLHGTKSEGDIVFNLLRVHDMKVSSVTFKIQDTVRSLKGKLDELIPKNSEVLDSIKKELVDPVFPGSNRDCVTQTSQQPDVLPRRSFHDDDPLRVGPSRRPEPIGVGGRWDPLRDPLAVGRSDLDPFARGGGMIFDPFSPAGGRGGFPDPGSGIPGGLPRGSVPPGARFDPVGPPSFGPRPPGRGSFNQPDHDHLPPPGYDDMFM